MAMAYSYRRIIHWRQLDCCPQQRHWLAAPFPGFCWIAVLSSLGRVSGLPVIDAALLARNAGHRMRLRVVLDQDTLPGPLRLIAFWSSGFRLVSEWYGWTLRD